MFDFKDLDQWAKEQKPVFIVGPERSGTSMMFRTMVSHPSFCSFDNATVETFCFIRPYDLLSPKGPNNYEMRLYLGRKYEDFFDFIKPIAGINNVCDQIGVSKSFLVENRYVVWNRRNYRELLRAFFYFSWLNLGNKRLAEKTPAHVRTIGQIFSCFPNAKILVCMRDPIEIIASHRKRYNREIELGKKADDPSIAWLNKSAEHYMEYFVHVNALYNMALKKYRDKMMIVPYSDVTKSRSFLDQVFSFVGEKSLDKYEDVNDVKDSSLKWDPLLSSMPKENSIDVEEWVSPEDIILARKIMNSKLDAIWY